MKNSFDILGGFKIKVGDFKFLKAPIYNTSESTNNCCKACEKNLSFPFIFRIKYLCHSLAFVFVMTV